MDAKFPLRENLWTGADVQIQSLVTLATLSPLLPVLDRAFSYWSHT